MTTNHFESLYSDPVAFNMKNLKSKLFMVLITMIRQQGWTQKAAAEQLQVSQPRISNLFKGHLDKFSIDTLIEMLVRIGYKIEPTFNPRNVDEPMQMTLKKGML